jgi:PAS domain S-box-containing protein
LPLSTQTTKSYRRPDSAERVSGQMTNIQNTPKKLNALLMCHLPMIFALTVLQFSLSGNSATSLQENLLTIIHVVGLSPLALLFLSKFPIQTEKGRGLEKWLPPSIVLVAIIFQLKELFLLFTDGKISTQAFTAQGALIPLLIIGESTPGLLSALDQRTQCKKKMLKFTLFLGILIAIVNLLEDFFSLSVFVSNSALILGAGLSLGGIVFFRLGRFRPENSKMLSILLYYCLQSAIMSLFLPVFDSQLNISILYLGVILALTIDSIFLRPEALAENGFSFSMATRRMRDVYEQKISDSASLSAATLDSLSARICILNSQGNITSVNRAWRTAAAEANQADESVYIGQDYFNMCAKAENKFFCPDEKALAGIREVLGGKREDYVTTQSFLSTNTKQWFILKVTQFETSQGRCAVLAQVDVTELKQAEEELLLKNAAIERANDGIVLTDPSLPDDPVVYVSPGFLKLTGYSRDEVLGRNCRFLHGPDTDPRTIERIHNALEAEQPFVGEIVNYTKTGRAWINRLKLEPIRDHQGRLLRYLGVQSDVTEQIKLENERNKALEQERLARVEAEKHFQEAKAASTLKDEFLATLSHELRTPAGVIGGFVELLKYEKLSESESEEALDAIERNSRSLVTLIDDILDVSRVITGKFKLAPKPVDLANVVESVIAAEMLAAQAKNIRIVTEFEPGLGPVYGDTTRLQQIFWNLLSNAIKFTPRNGRVKVTLKMDGNRAMVKIADTGVGIEGQFLPHVFERFRQQDSGMNRAYGGLGLGLSIVKHLVELHGGLVTAESDGKGKGSIFTVSLPVLTAAG